MGLDGKKDGNSVLPHVSETANSCQVSVIESSKTPWPTGVSKEEIAGRVRWALRNLAVSQKAVAAAMGRSEGEISTWANGRRGIGQANAKKLADALGVNAAWLAQGVGDPLAVADQDASAATIERVRNEAFHAGRTSMASVISAAIAEALLATSHIDHEIGRATREELSHIEQLARALGLPHGQEEKKG